MNYNIGFVGYSATDFDHDAAQAIIDDIFDELEAKYAPSEVNIISGATKLGIPAMVYETAVRRMADNDHVHYKLTGIMCKDGYTCELFPCDVIYAVGDNWGDESETFLSSINTLYKIGGGKQSIAEYERAQALKIVCKQFDL